MAQPIVVGHRGAAGLAPENTLTGFRRALDTGITWLELDVHLTRDGVPICIHDSRLDRLTAERGLVSERDWAELSAVPVLPWAFEGAYPNATIPSLESVLRELPANTHFVVELKSDPEREEALVRTTLQLLTDTGTEGRCRVISFEPTLLRLCRQVAGADCPPLGVLVSQRNTEQLVPLARELDAEAIHPPHEILNADLVAAAREAGWKICSWTVNTREAVLPVAALGVEEVTTDYPDMVLATLAGLETEK
jgi:glycerophosphoryl diester phosphodiesterase